MAHITGTVSNSIALLRHKTPTSLWQEVPIEHGAVAIDLPPGRYEVQWIPHNATGLIPTEVWIVPDLKEIDLTALSRDASGNALVTNPIALIERVSELEAIVQDLRTQLDKFKAARANRKLAAEQRAAELERTIATQSAEILALKAQLSSSVEVPATDASTIGTDAYEIGTTPQDRRLAHLRSLAGGISS